MRGKSFGTALVLLGTLATGCDGLIDHTIRQELERTNRAILEDGKLHVVLLGTGTPQMSTKHGPAATAIVADGHVLLFDAGEGTVARIHAQRLPLDAVANVFITHWHSDHFAGLGEVINQTWIWNRRVPIRVHGPEGVAQVVGGIRDAYRLDHAYRTVNGDAVDPERLAVAETQVVAPTGLEHLAPVWKADGITVSAFYVTHQPVEPALGYKIEWGGRTVVISGDTRVTPQMLTHGTGADVWVHEALNRALFERGVAVMRDLGRTDQAARAEHVVSYHADTIELAKQAQAAGVEALVLTHLIPAPPNRIAEYMFTRGMAEHYQGELIVGRDAMQITLQSKH